jgi:hypothetical protein
MMLSLVSLIRSCTGRVVESKSKKYASLSRWAGSNRCAEHCIATKVTTGIDLALSSLMSGLVRILYGRREPMPTEIGHEEVRRMVEDGAQLVEVLPKEEYEAEHLPRTIHIPLPQLDRQTTTALQQDQPVIVYCYDSQ